MVYSSLIVSVSKISDAINDYEVSSTFRYYSAMLWHNNQNRESSLCSLLCWQHRRRVVLAKYLLLPSYLPTYLPTYLLALLKYLPSYLSMQVLTPG